MPAIWDRFFIINGILLDRKVVVKLLEYLLHSCKNYHNVERHLKRLEFLLCAAFNLSATQFFITNSKLQICMYSRIFRKKYNGIYP